VIRETYHKKLPLYHDQDLVFGSASNSLKKSACNGGDGAKKEGNIHQVKPIILDPLASLVLEPVVTEEDQEEQVGIQTNDCESQRLE
jgi:hypothetical protein